MTYPQRVLAGVRAAERDGRLPAPDLEVLGETWPFEPPTSVVPVPDLESEPPRHGEDAASCDACTATELQLRGSLLGLWLDVLPPLAEDAWRADLERVREALRS